MTRSIVIAALALIVVIGAIAGTKVLQLRQMMSPASQPAPPPETVTTAEVRADTWESALTATGSLVAVQGVTVAAELPGKVVRIAFEPGARVVAGDLLVQQDVSSEQAQLPGAEAAVELARKNRDRSAELLTRGLIARADHDAAMASLTQATSQADTIRAAIQKKSIRAPFTGRLGIRQVNLGQILATGDPIVSLQALDPIFVNFMLPQQELARIRTGFPVQVTTDALPRGAVEGRITAVHAEVDPATRAIRVQATLANPRERLRPGMFAQVRVVLPTPRPVLAIPATAVLYAPYSDSVFVVAAAPDGQPGRVVRQQLVRLGDRRGDFVAVLSGLTAGETVVSTGVFKLRNGQAVVVDNALAPRFTLSPRPANE